MPAHNQIHHPQAKELTRIQKSAHTRDVTWSTFLQQTIDQVVVVGYPFLVNLGL
jgi:hypothetical protein